MLGLTNNFLDDKEDCIKYRDICFLSTLGKDACDKLFVNCLHEARGDSMFMLYLSLILLGAGAGTVTVPILLELV